MGKRNRRRRHKKQNVRPDQQLPGTFLRTVERWERLLPTLRQNPDLATEVERRRSRLEEVLAPVDAVELLGQLVMSEMPMSAHSYVESEHAGSAYVVELATAVLAARADRRGSSEPGRAIDANTLGPTRELISEIALLEGLRRYRGAGALSDDDPLGGAHGRAAMAHLVLRGPGWPWQENDALRGLFAPFSSKLGEVLGFDAADAVACSEAGARLIPRQLSGHMDDSHNHLDEALTWAEVALSGWQDQPPEPIRDRALTAVWALMQAGDAMLLRPEALAAEASVSIETADAYLATLSTAFGQTDSLFKVAVRIRFAPYLRVADAYFLTVPGNDLWALRPLFEQTVKGERYARHRGRWLEQRAVELLVTPLTPDEVHTGIKLIDSDGHTELGEIDGLLRFGDTILLIEAKAATMRPGARRGGRALEDHLKATLAKATEQATLAREVLQGQRAAMLRTTTGQALELGETVREVHPVLVTLDDLSAIAPVVWEIAGSAVLPAGVTIPWILTLHELDLVSQTVQSPVQLIHFLRRRSRLNQLGGRIAHDELDWWMLYLKSGLYFEEDAAKGPVRYLSQTDELDAWVLHERGLRDRPAPKPRQRLEKVTERLLETLVEERPPGWVSAGCTLLSVSGESRESIGRDLSAARHRAGRRDLIQRGAYGYAEGPDPMLICWVVAPDSQAQVLSEILEDYVAERLQEFGLQRVLGFGLTASTERPYDALLTLDRATWESPED